jgi:ankyrin repeat protein
MYAAALGTMQICILLLENGADIEAKNKNGITALMYAAALGTMQICILLLENGADIDAKNIEGRPASVMAEINQSASTAAFLKLMETMQESMGRDSFKAFMNSFGECLAA